MEIIDGKKMQDEIVIELQQKVNRLKTIPKLVIIQVGNDLASNKYVAQKIKIGTTVGIKVEHINFEEQAKEETIIDKINELNHNDNVNGIMVQLPLPQNFNEEKIVNSVSSNKDVDGLTTINIGNLFDEKDAFIPCTALGIMEMFTRTNITLEGKHVVIIGRSKLVGKPLIACLLNENATVTVCHSKTKNLKDITSKADILIVAVGKKYFINELDMIKDNAIIIDVGINVEEGKIYGDVEMESLKQKVSYITPVPNGVGRMTVISLMNNVIKAYLEQTNNY